MVDMKRHLIRHSVTDVIHILENVPVRVDMILQIPIIQTINRVSLAHLSIERAMKFLIIDAGQTYKENHHLPLHLGKLRECEPETVKFLEDAFDDAVRHYRFKPNNPGMGHLKSLVAYLEYAGSHKGFIDIRYWELDQSLDAILLRRIFLNLHLELLHALSEVLLAPDRLKDTVSLRVERAVKRAMTSTRDLACSVGSEKELAVKSYLEWVTRSGFANFREAITTAFKEGLATGDDYAAGVISKAHQELINSVDPAVRYFADILDVLPRQPRDVIPCVEWLGPEKEVSGMVRTPAGTHLGKIQRGYDGFWRITPARDGQIKAAAKAETQKDARCYLAALLTRPVQLTAAGRTETRRVVNRGYTFIQSTGDPSSGQSYEVTFWEKDHGLAVGNAVEIKLLDHAEPASSLVQILEGIVTEVAEHEVSILGSDVFDIRMEDENTSGA